MSGTENTNTVDFSVYRESDFQKMERERQEEKLKFYTVRANEERAEEQEQSNIMNMRFGQVLQRLAVTIVEVLSELTDPEYLRERGVRDILFSNDRFIFLGLLLIIVSFLLYLFDVAK